MAGEEKDFLAQARREGRILHEHGVRLEEVREIDPATIGERPPADSPHTRGRLYPGRQSHPMSNELPGDRPVIPVPEHHLRQAQPADVPSEHRLEHMGWNEAEQKRSQERANQQTEKTKGAERAKAAERAQEPTKER